MSPCMMISWVSISFALFSLTISNALKLIDGRIKISIVTTSGCTDTTSFLTQQLADTYWEYRDFLEVEFIPWGRTRYKEDGLMWCQFGPNDCWANRVHRCALALLDNQDAQVLYMTCEFTSPHSAFAKGSYFCAKSMGIEVTDLNDCVTTTAGAYLDEINEEKARHPMQYINFVPSIYFNDVFDLEEHNQARVRLKSMICSALAEDPKTGVTDCDVSDSIADTVWSSVKQEFLDTISDVRDNLSDDLLN